MKWNIIPMALLMLFLTSGCTEDDPTPTPTPAPTPTPTEKDPEVLLRNDGTFGRILTDEDGMTLYFFSNDITGESTCTGGCLTNWPAYHIASLKVGSGLSTGDFGEITRADGAKQTTYKGWPLYYFKNDTSAGETNGEGANNVWWVAKPDYSIMVANGQLVGADGKNYTGNFEEGEGMTPFYTDAAGRTLYAFKNDKAGQNNFTKEDFSNDSAWPIYHTTMTELPSTLNADDFGEIDVFGRKQMTFKGWPLYYFGKDDARGTTKGVSVPSPGVWPIVNKGTVPAEEPEMEAATYSADIEPIMKNSCAFSGCHNSSSRAAGIDLSAFTGVKRIADNGKLVGTTFQLAGFSPMPRGGSKLDQAKLDKIKSWVDAGAENN